MLSWTVFSCRLYLVFVVAFSSRLIGAATPKTGEEKEAAAPDCCAGAFVPGPDCLAGTQ